MDPIHEQLLAEVRRRFAPSQADLGRLSGCSRRTVQRWDAGRGIPYAGHFHDLAKAVHSQDPALAARLAEAGGTTLAALGLVSREPAEVHAAAAANPRYLVDSVVCAGADASGVLSAPMRAGLRAAVVRARALGLSLEALEAGLGSAQEGTEQNQAS